MPNFDSRFWNLSQAAAWVVYRKRKLVEEFSEQSGDAWRALILYPGEYKPVGKLDELVKALTLGKLTAWGRRNEFNDKLEAIPEREWTDLRISPPSVKRSHRTAGQIEPWTGLRFESNDLKKLWRSHWETDGSAEPAIDGPPLAARPTPDTSTDQPLSPREKRKSDTKKRWRKEFERTQEILQEHPKLSGHPSVIVTKLMAEDGRGNDPSKRDSVVRGLNKRHAGWAG